MWKRGKKYLQNVKIPTNVNRRKMGKYGRKRISDHDIVLKIGNLSIHERQTYERMAQYSGINKEVLVKGKKR